MPRTKKTLRPYKSVSRPTIGIATVAATKICSRSPRIAVKAAEVCDDDRHRGGDDGLTQRGHKHRQHHAQHRQHYLFCGKLYEVFFPSTDRWKQLKARSASTQARIVDLRGGEQR